MNTMDVLRYLYDPDHGAKLSLAEARVLGKLAMHLGGETNEVWPSIGSIERSTGLSRSSVCRAIDGLCKKRLIKRLKRGNVGSPTRYLVSLSNYTHDGTSPTVELVPQSDGGSPTMGLGSPTMGPDPTKNKPLNKPLGESAREARLTKPKVRKWTTVPEDWQPDERHRDLASQLGLDLNGEVAKFRDHEFRTPKSDPGRAFAGWLRRAAEWQTTRPGPAPGRRFGPQAEQPSRYEIEERKRLEQLLGRQL